MKELIETYKALRDEGMGHWASASLALEMSRLRQWLPRRLYLMVGRGGQEFDFDDLPMRIEWFGRVIWTDKRWPMENKYGRDGKSLL